MTTRISPALQNKIAGELDRQYYKEPKLVGVSEPVGDKLGFEVTARHLVPGMFGGFDDLGTDTFFGVYDARAQALKMRPTRDLAHIVGITFLRAMPQLGAKFKYLEPNIEFS